ncbi:MAG TPA: glycoside hydrolase family 15 protein [Caulobacteraceae bacterium]|nr:glycoside hydrolase family 15 protein [Caulobacteraceae bacterium]
MDEQPTERRNRRIEDYGLIGNNHTAALVHRCGDIDWLCLPKFDSPAIFAALLGDEDNGCWSLRASDPKAKVTRRYRAGTAILETTFTTRGGAATVIDFMPTPGVGGAIELVRLVRGDRGAIDFETAIRFRFDYGQQLPWVRANPVGLTAVAGPDAVRLVSTVPLTNKDFATRSTFRVRAGETVDFSLIWYASHLPPPDCRAPEPLLAQTQSEWAGWIASSNYDGPHRELVERSLITLKLLTYQPTGGIVAAPTTSLPEQIGGPRNWDYRYCWVRDATLSLYAFLSSGFHAEAEAWRRWVMRAAAGSPQDLQIMYGLHGERRLWEYEIPRLAGFAQSRPVRIGNQAHEQRQLDIYGELIGGIFASHRMGANGAQEAWPLLCVAVDFLESIWREPDNGIWEVRGPRRHFTHSKLMAWVAFDRAIALAEQLSLKAPLDRWRNTRKAVHAEICERGWNPKRKAFVQYYGGDTLDAALLIMPLTGFLPVDDPRLQSTIRAIERELMPDGLVQRYTPAPHVDGLPPGEGAFLACSFWLCDVYKLSGRARKAAALFKKLLGAANDLGLFAEEYDPRAKRQLGNFPQAFSHVGLINSAHILAGRTVGAMRRAERERDEPLG